MVGMSAVRLLLAAALVASAGAPATAAAAVDPPCRWSCGEGATAVDHELMLPCAVRARLAQLHHLDTAAVVWGKVELPPPPRGVVAVGATATIANPPPPAAVLPSAPKPSPPA